jgi:hypothetical protein
VSFPARILPLLLFPFQGDPARSSIARLERALSNSSYPFLKEWQGCHSLRASSDHRFIVGALRARRAPGRSFFLPYFTRKGFEFSPEAVVMVRRTKPFFPPCGTTAVILSLVCLNWAG